MHFFKYKAKENALYEYADDIAPRHLTVTLPLDYDTVAGADKFGNIFITRLPSDVSSQVCACMHCQSTQVLLEHFLQSMTER